MTDPCQICGGTVRIKTQTIRTLGDDSVLEERVCLNRTCETNEKPATMGTPLP